MTECNSHQFSMMILFRFIHQASALYVRTGESCLCLVWNVDIVDWMCPGDRWQGCWTTWFVLHSTQRFDIPLQYTPWNRGTWYIDTDSLWSGDSV